MENFSCPDALIYNTLSILCSPIFYFILCHRITRTLRVLYFMRKLYFIIYYKNTCSKKYFQFYAKFKSIMILKQKVILFLAKISTTLVITVIFFSYNPVRRKLIEKKSSVYETKYKNCAKCISEYYLLLLINMESVPEEGCWIPWGHPPVFIRSESFFRLYGVAQYRLMYTL